MRGRLNDGTDLTSLQRCLHRVTERLARELASPCARSPDWSDFEWSVAPAVAGIHGVSPLLASVLQWSGPPAWSEFLQAQREHTRARHARIQDLLQKLAKRATSAGVAFVALKGAALHAMGIYQPGYRPMSDIDLLSSDTERATQLLRGLGYRWVLRTPKHDVFEPHDWQPTGNLGEHRDNGIRIELHNRILEALPLRETDISYRIYPQRPHPGLNDYPSTAALMSHLVLHAAGAMALQSIRLLHLHDMARVAARMSRSDWSEFLRHEPGEPPWWALPPLALTARYFNTIPAEVLAAVEPCCPWVLRSHSRSQTLSGVSLSNLWITAFPGIEWSQSVRDLMRFARARILPTRETLEARRNLAAMEPSLSGGEWAELSQSRRILRWLTSRPARTETLAAIHAALARAR